MLTKLIDALFGCWHNHLSFPITSRPGSRRSQAASLTGTYVVCLDCGREFGYDWREMRVVNSVPELGSAVSDLVTKHAA